MNPRVLIVDDSEYTVETLRDLLNEEFEVVGATGDGQEAISLYRELDPDLVVMDLVIEGLDGIAATARIKDLDPASQVVVLTSHDNVAKKREAADAGADEYFSKPFDPEDFIDSLRTLATA